MPYFRINIVLDWRVAPNYINRREYSGTLMFTQGLKAQSEFAQRKGSGSVWTWASWDQRSKTIWAKVTIMTWIRPSTIAGLNFFIIYIPVFFAVCARFCVSHCPLRLTSASDMFIVNQKPDLAGGHGQSVRKEITHNERTHAVKKHLGHLFWHLRIQYVMQIFSDTSMLILLSWTFFFSGDAWLNHLIPLTWQAAISWAEW